MNSDSKIYIAGHQGLVGSAVYRALHKQGFKNLVVRTHAELDLEDQQATANFFQQERPDIVVMAAAKVGGIHANHAYPVDFLMRNLAIEQHVLQSAHDVGVKKLLLLGSSCIYPKDCPQPIRESDLLTGELEPTNRPYALAKIAGVEMCWAFNRQYGTQWLTLMPTNLYGPGDQYDLENSHVLPALIRKIHEAKMSGANEVVLWGSGTPKREFLYSEDLADAIIFLLRLGDKAYATLVNPTQCPLINIGYGEDLTIEELARLIAGVIGYQGAFRYDKTKPDGTMRKLLDSSKMMQLGWRPRVGLEEGIGLAYEDFLGRVGKHD